MLIAFQIDSLRTCYINPARVDAVMSGDGCVEIYVGGADKPFCVRGSSEDVAKKIQAALKK